jgi:hypothetical protein
MMSSVFHRMEKYGELKLVQEFIPVETFAFLHVGELKNQFRENLACWNQGVASLSQISD